MKKSSAIVFLSKCIEFHTCATVKEHIEDKIFKSCIFYYIIYTTMEALLYQPLRFILTFKSNRSIVSFGRKHCKYDMHRNFHASFLGIAFKYFIDDKDYTAQSVCKNY